MKLLTAWIDEDDTDMACLNMKNQNAVLESALCINILITLGQGEPLCKLIMAELKTYKIIKMPFG